MATHINYFPSSATVLLFLLLVSTLPSTARSNDSPGAGNDDDGLPCLKKLLPCSEYLKGGNPPPTCCLPLMETVKDEPSCLCKLFFNEELLKSFNVTQDDALKLPAKCGGKAPNLSICKTEKDTPTPATPAPPTPETPAKAQPKGPSSSTVGLGKSMTSPTTILTVGGVLCLTMLF